MTRTYLYLINNSDETLEFRNPPCEPSHYHGSDWLSNGKLTIPARGTKIAPHQKKLLGSIGDPGSESNHWGWIYLYSEKHDDFIQCYIISKGDKASGNRAGIDWYWGQNISDQQPNVSGLEVGASRQEKNGNFYLEYHPAEDFATRPASPKLEFDLKVNAELIETFVLRPKTEALERTNAYALTVRIGENKLNSGDARLFVPEGLEVSISGAAGAAKAIPGQARVLDIPRAGCVITITVPVSGIEVPNLHLDFLNQHQSSLPYRVELHPAELALQRMTQRGFDPASLPQATRAAPGVKRDAASREAVSSMLGQLKQLERHLPRRAVPLKAECVNVELPGTVVSLLRDARVHNLRDCCFGLSLEGAAARYYEDEGARAVIDRCKEECEKRGIDSSVVTSFDTLWDKIEKGLNEIKEFFIQVVGKVVNFFVQIGEQIFNVVLTIASGVIKAIGWVLENVLGIDMNDVVAWLGYVFDWEAIKRTQREIVQSCQHGLRTLLNQREPAKARVAELRELLIRELGLETYENRLRFKEGALDALGGKLSALSGGPSGWGQFRNSSRSISVGDADFDADTPALRWAADAAAGDDSADLAHHPGLADVVAKVQLILQRLIDDAKAFVPDIEATAALVSDYFANVTLSTLFETLIHAFKQLATGVVHLLEHAADLAIDALFGLLDLARDLLSVSIPFPFVGALYRQYIDASVPAPNLIELMSLLVAIPTAVLMKWLPEPVSDDSGAPHETARRRMAASAAASSSMRLGAEPPSDKLAVASGACQLVSSSCYGGMELLRIGEMRAAVAWPLFCKLAVDVIGYGCSVASLATYVATTRGDELTGRERLDIAIAASLAIPRATDLVRFISFWPAINESSGPKIRRTCARLDTTFSVIGLLFLLIPDLTLQAEERGRAVHPDWELTKVALKGTQLSLAYANGILAWPRELCVNTKKEVEIGVALLRGFIQFSNGVFVIARAGYNLGHPRRPVSGAIFA